MPDILRNAPPPPPPPQLSGLDAQEQGLNGLNTIATQFYTAGLKYSLAIQPYALKLFFTLLLIDIVVTWIQYTAEGQLDPSFFSVA